jgi:hypothetical protein
LSLQNRFKKSVSIAATTTTKIAGIHDDQHYPPSYWAKKWGLSENFIRPLFVNEPGVIKIARPEDLKKKKRAYTSLRIPASVAARVHERLHGKVAAAA